MRRMQGDVILLHGGLGDSGDSAGLTSVLAGLGNPEGVVWCSLNGPRDDKNLGALSLAYNLYIAQCVCPRVRASLAVCFLKKLFQIIRS